MTAEEVRQEKIEQAAEQLEAFRHSVVWFAIIPRCSICGCSSPQYLVKLGVLHVPESLCGICHDAIVKAARKLHSEDKP